MMSILDVLGFFKIHEFRKTSRPVGIIVVFVFFRPPGLFQGYLAAFGGNLIALDRSRRHVGRYHERAACHGADFFPCSSAQNIDM